MAYALVGSAGAVTQGAASAAVTPAWGTGENRTAGNLLVCFVSSSGSSTIPATPSGWTKANSFADGIHLTSAAVFYRIATGSDAAPTIAAVTSAVIAAQLAEFSGNSNPAVVDSSILPGAASGTTSPIVATNNSADPQAGDLICTAAAIRYSAAATKTLADTLNNGATTNDTTNAAVSTANHYAFSWGVASSFASPDSDSLAFTTTRITGALLVLASFAPASGGGTTAKSGSDTAAGADAASAVAVQTPADSSTLSDAPGQVGLQPAADAATATDATSGLAITPVGDAATATDAASVGLAPSGDAATAVDSASVSASASASDAAAATDAASVGLGIGDVAGATDTATGLAVGPVAETSATTDAAALVAITQTDVATATDAAAGAGPFSTDTASAVESAQVSASASDAETATLGDAPVEVDLSGAGDTATITEGASVVVLQFVSDGDTATVTESATVTVVVIPPSAEEPAQGYDARQAARDALKKRLQIDEEEAELLLLLALARRRRRVVRIKP